MLIKDHHTYTKRISAMDMIERVCYVSSPVVASLVINMTMVHNNGEQIFHCFLPTNSSALLIGALHESHIEPTDGNYVYNSLSFDHYCR